MPCLTVMKLDLRKIYRFEPIPHNADGSLPKGGDIYYECADCKGIVSSVSYLKTACACGNLKGGGGSVDVGNAERVMALKGKLR